MFVDICYVLEGPFLQGSHTRYANTYAISHITAINYITACKGCSEYWGKYYTFINFVEC